MLISELIKELEQRKQKLGDITVTLNSQNIKSIVSYDCSCKRCIEIYETPTTLNLGY